jgi:site-specific DNA-methyltransferase (adenine-specific)
MQYTNENCMDLMKRYPDKLFALAIVDPPYFSGPERRKYYGSSISTTKVKRRCYPVSEYWNVPTAEYFNELFRVSKNQIIWGCNYYNFIFPGSGRIIWDKCNGKSSFSDCEIAYCSLHKSVRMFRFMWNGMMQGKSIEEGHIAQGNKKLNEKRIHTTQKPVALYEWLLRKYAQSGDVILDTHVGSASSLIACEKLGFDYVACEIDPEYYKLSSERLEVYRNAQFFN